MSMLDDPNFVGPEDDDDMDEANQVYEEDDAATQDAETEDVDYAPEHGDDTVLSPAKREVARAEAERLKSQSRQKKELLERMREQQNALATMGDAERARHRINFLLKQAEIFQHFASDSAIKEAKKAKAKGRGTRKEEDEDAELLKDEDDGGVNAGHRLQVQPSIITGGTLREYQMQGLNWMIHLYDNGINGILADEMGLGKTLQTISLVAYLYEYRGITGPHIVITPKSTLGNWVNEFRRFCPIIRVTKFHGNNEERMHQKESTCAPGRFDVVVTSYEMVIKEKNHFKRFHWRYIIIDEAHRIKNENSRLSQVVRQLKTNYRLLITGTPLQNNLHELWALLNFLLPEIFSSAEKFEEWFSMGDGSKEKEAEVVQQLHKVLRPFLLRRVKSDVERGLPPKKETILKIGMSDMQKKWYAALLQKDIDALNGGADRAKLLNVVMQLRKCCNHPYLFQGAEPGPPFITGEHLIENSGKLVLLDKLLPRLKERDSRVLIFSQMTRMIDILEDYCLYRGYGYCRIDGNTGGDDRDNMIDEFNKPNSSKFIFLLSTRAGGLGINLATADIVVLYDSDWNPQMDLQAMDRAHRIGQKKEVQVFRFCIENSIEEKVIEKAYKKLRLDALVIQQGRLTENNATKVNKDDLINMVRYGAELVFSSDSSNITDADIDAIIKKGERDTADLNQKMQQFTENAMKFTMDGGIAYDYKDEDEGGTDIGDLKAIMGSNWVDPPKRERKRHLLNYNDAEYYKNAMKAGAKGDPRGPRLPKMPVLQDFQFYNVTRIQELYEKEHLYETHKHAMAAKEASLKNQGASEEALAEALTPSADDPQPLTEEEQAEREQLLEDGFKDWTKRDFNAFVRACEKYGRENIPQIAAEVDGKTDEEVHAYAKVFWKRYRELSDWEKVIKNIERGEQKIQRQQDIMNAVAAKLERYKNPWQELKIQYGANKGKAYTEEEDRFILCMVHKLGYGNWDDLKAEIRKSWRFRFDWFFKSRTPQELGRRCETLIRLIEKENEDMKEETDKGTRGRGGGGGGRGGGRGGRGGGAAGAEGAGTGRKRKSTAAGASAAATPAIGGTPQPGSEDGSPQPPDRKKGRV
ncbi:hypothetical protein VOLCADRAFT_80059 [Volvox carteri f. nagariensis]|uniref:Uncharacterized protein n=1 Tax=Volvox carteri f. nagariensis TaxID=3068 RepID=D8TP34_VOLCA|nr:uncharacterized protein VOLCADRAFT_80059 [Volvox carteri f. nagariensis]EFJ50690.1 hypothetical protein VOLCADRAFT_80059 [Volvox carteri f. nagariensis]|eukprot:XP_002948283.1 hypothetical protein VOLCADRAFT_80059 [Volvox carteri f. nagariensis]